MKTESPTVTRTQELVLEPRILTFAGRLYFGAAAGVALIVLLAVVAVRELAVIEPILAEQGANASRAVLYELPAGGEVHVPIEPHTDVLRFVVHAYRRGEMPMTPRPALLLLAARGDRGARTEELRLTPPGLRSRVTPEERGLAIGDPIPVEVDVHDVGVGELVVSLKEIDEADGLVVRVYRREQLSEVEGSLRGAALDRAKKDELARWTWELGWDELAPSEQSALLRTRWRKIGAVRGLSADLRSLTVAVSPPAPHPQPVRRDELLGRLALRGDERVAVVVRPGGKLFVVTEESTVLRATVRDANNRIETPTATGHIELGPYPDMRSVEVGVDRDVLAEVRSPQAEAIEWLGWADAYRVTARRPMVVESSDADRVLRVTLRRPVARNQAAQVHLAVKVQLTGKGPKPLVQSFGADRPRSRVDRYQDLDSTESPSDRAAFYVALPRGSSARIAPAGDEALDVSLSELDETRLPLPLSTRPAGAPPPAIVEETEDTPSAFVARKPSNAAAFESGDAHKVVRIARWFAPLPPPATVALGHARHTNADRQDRGGKPFEGIAHAFELEADARRPLYVPVAALANVPTTLRIDLERDARGPMQLGVHAHWTLPRTMTVGANETHASFVIGDEVPAREKIRVRITAAEEPKGAKETRGARVLVHLPWVSQRAVGPRWIAGAFEE